LAAAVVSAIATAFYAYLVGPLLRAVLTQVKVQWGPLSIEPVDLAWKLPLIVSALAIVKAAAQFLQSGWTHATAQLVTADIRRDLFARLLELPPRFFEARHSGELLSRFTADVARVEFSVTQSLTSYLRDALQIVALLGTCLWLDARLFLLAFIVLPAAIIPVSRFAHSLKKVSSSTQASLGQLTELTAEQLHNLPIIQAYRAIPRSLARFHALQSQYLRVMDRSLLLRGAFTPTLEFLGILGIALAVGVGARAVSAEPALAGKLLSFLAAALLMYQPLKGLSGTLSLVVQGVGSAERLFEILDQPVPSTGSREAAPLRKEIRFREVSFSYPGDRQALRNISFSIPAGKRIALVGESGAGKSTLFSLVLGFAFPDQGSITWDGEELSAYRLASLRAQIAWVPQEPVLFSKSIRFNLLLGSPEAGDAELWEALRRAHALDFVRALPRALDQSVGERGSMLSGGQRQRLAIARAFLRRPSVLLMDEPTSSLDAASEHEVQAGISELMEGRTTIVIAHRLSTVRDADWIYVLHGGTVLEQGTHQELVARQGQYVHLLRQGQQFFEASASQ
jgi:subfamily B ATP-binding cassette protein MsbA